MSSSIPEQEAKSASMPQPDLNKGIVRMHADLLIRIRSALMNSQHVAVAAEINDLIAAVACAEDDPPHYRKLTEELSLNELSDELRAVASLGGDVTLSSGACFKLSEALGLSGDLNKLATYPLSDHELKKPDSTKLFTAEDWTLTIGDVKSARALSGTSMEAQTQNIRDCDVCGGVDFSCNGCAKTFSLPGGQSVRSEADTLKFANIIINGVLEGSDWDGGTVQDIAESCGLLKKVMAQESCGAGCQCAETVADFPTICYRKTYASAACFGNAPAPIDGVRWDLFPGYLIDHHEGDIVTEESLQGWLAEMLKHPDYLTIVSNAREGGACT
jgi:hypothetical protein